MKQFLTVLKFELNNYFKNKSFLLTTIVLIVLAVGIIAIPGVILGGGGSDSDNSASGNSGSESSQETETLALYDVNGSIADPQALSHAMGMNIEWLECSDENQVEDAVTDGTALAGFIV